jgi:hypothetical protein
VAKALNETIATSALTHATASPWILIRRAPDAPVLGSRRD